MPAFTVELWRAIEFTDGDIGLSTYPIFDQAYRPKLNKKIIDHYYNREIGLETVDLFVHATRTKMNEIMPYYNQLYKSELLEVDPFLTFDTRATNTATQASSTESESSGESGSMSEAMSRAVNSSFPQMMLSGNKDYATEGADNRSSSESTGESSETSTVGVSGESEAETVSRGFNGAMSELLNRYRDTFLNVDMMVISSLEELFMQIWNTGDSYSERRYWGGLHI